MFSCQPLQYRKVPSKEVGMHDECWGAKVTHKMMYQKVPGPCLADSGALVHGDFASTKEWRVDEAGWYWVEQFNAHEH